MTQSTIFLSTPSARRATKRKDWSTRMELISIHALREEGDNSSPSFLHALVDFYPRPPRGGRHTSVPSLSQAWIFLSTPSARRATYGWVEVPHIQLISIHALREEGDVGCWVISKSLSNFYPRPPRGGRRPRTIQQSLQRIFLSTPSARRATCPCRGLHRRTQDFYPRPPRGGRLTSCAVCAVARLFLSTPSARRATHVSFPCFHARLFLSTPSARRATKGGHCTAVAQLISIHALREEGDTGTAASPKS